MARPAHQPDPAERRQVETLAGFGVPETDIATVIGIDPKTLRRHYREEPSSGPMGRPRHQPEPFHRRQVEAMAAYGVPEADIAKVLGIDPKTLRKHYRTELDTGQVKATAKVAEFLFRKATTEGSQCVTAAIFWLKTRGGWRETPQDHTVAVRDLSHISDADLDRMSETLQAAIAAEDAGAKRPILDLRSA